MELGLEISRYTTGIAEKSRMNAPKVGRLTFLHFQSHKILNTQVQLSTFFYCRNMIFLYNLK